MQLTDQEKRVLKNILQEIPSKTARSIYIKIIEDEVFERRMLEAVSEQKRFKGYGG